MTPQPSSASDPVLATIHECVRAVLPGVELGHEENFFEAGGDSLALLGLIARIQDTFGLELAPVDVFSDPTVAGLAAAVRAARELAPDLVAEVASLDDEQVRGLLAELADDATAGVSATGREVRA